MTAKYPKLLLRIFPFRVEILSKLTLIGKSVLWKLILATEILSSVLMEAKIDTRDALHTNMMLYTKHMLGLIHMLVRTCSMLSKHKYLSIYVFFILACKNAYSSK